MTQDEALRALARASQAQPDDVALSRDLRVALLRAGDPRAAALELGRAVRLGHAGAREELAQWATWPAPRRVRSAAVAPLPRESIRETRATLPIAFVEVAGATPDTVFVVGENREALPVDADGLVHDPFARDSTVLAALSLRPLALRWSRGSAGHLPESFGLLGDDLLKADGGALEIVDGSTGRAARRIELPASARDLVVEGDRALVSLFSESPALLALDLVAGRAVWESASSATGVDVSVVAGRVWCTSPYVDRPVEVLELETGRKGDAPHHVDRSEVIARIVASDEQGVVLLNVLPGAGRESAWLAERAIANGARRWRREGWVLSRCLALGARVASVIDGGLEAIDRKTGKLLWKHPIDERPRSGVAPTHALAVAGDVAYLGCADPDGVTLIAFDTSSGARVFERRFPVAVDSRPVGFEPGGMAVRGFDLVPVPSGVLILVASEGKTVAIRLGAEQDAAGLPRQ